MERVRVLPQPIIKTLELQASSKTIFDWARELLQLWNADDKRPSVYQRQLKGGSL